MRQGLHREVVLLAGGDHDSRLFATELTNMLNRRGGGLRFRADFRPASGGVEGAVREVLRLQPACLVISAAGRRGCRGRLPAAASRLSPHHFRRSLVCRAGLPVSPGRCRSRADLSPVLATDVADGTVL